MESLIKADIFFFISSLATVVLVILISILLFYLIKTSRNLYNLSEALKGDFKESEEFIAELKERLENNMIFQIFFPLSRRRKRLEAKENSIKSRRK
ncbi:MAG: hypothetical protein Q7S82_02730 [bacterium]|nr:hypothetical protein [bacterium]